jgi:hypothetical protein
MNAHHCYPPSTLAVFYVYDSSLILLFLHLWVLSVQSLALIVCELIRMCSFIGIVIDRRTRQ